MIRTLIKKLSLVGLGLILLGATTAFSTWLFLKHQVQGRVVVIPDLFNMTEQQARDLCKAEGLVLQPDSAKDIYSNVIERGHVLLQVPRPGRKVKSRRVVEISLSAGPEQKQIPELAGQTVQFSETLLRREGFDMDTVTRIPSNQRKKGRVLEQVPDSGGDLGLRAGVSVLVSDGPDEPWFVTPDFIGKDYAEVMAFLDRHDFRVTTKYKAGDLDLGPVVLEQSPKAGFPCRKSQNITLTVNKDY